MYELQQDILKKKIYIKAYEKLSQQYKNRIYYIMKKIPKRLFHILELLIGLMGREFAKGPCHTKDFKNGTWYLLA